MLIIHSLYFSKYSQVSVCLSPCNSDIGVLRSRDENIYFIWWIKVVKCSERIQFLYLVSRRFVNKHETSSLSSDFDNKLLCSVNMCLEKLLRIWWVSIFLIHKLIVSYQLLFLLLLRLVLCKDFRNIWRKLMVD